jgi:transcriptional regulator with XRE-family HTH domain
MIELQIHLLRKGIKNKQLAEKLGVSQAYMSMFLNGQRSGKALRRRLVDELGFPPKVVGLEPKPKLSRDAA